MLAYILAQAATPSAIPTDMWSMVYYVIAVAVGYYLRHKGISLPGVTLPNEPSSPATPAAGGFDISKLIPNIPGRIWDDIAREVAMRLQRNLFPPQPAQPGQPVTPATPAQAVNLQFELMPPTVRAVEAPPQG